jgi:cytochrome c556
MKGKKMKRSLILATATFALSLLTLTAQAVEPLAFQGVMKDLGKHMQTITAAIAYENWELVAQTAPLIAAHPQPPAMEKTRIISFMGSSMGKFKEFDMQTHEAAHQMEHAAHEKDGMQVIAAFQKVQTSCLGCHQAFRKPFVAHFYGKQ